MMKILLLEDDLILSEVIVEHLEANNHTVEYEHALKSASSEEGYAEDMSKMKAMGKCGSE